jgi:hypothetical protein
LFSSKRFDTQWIGPENYKAAIADGKLPPEGWILSNKGAMKSTVAKGEDDLASIQGRWADLKSVFVPQSSIFPSSFFFITLQVAFSPQLGFLDFFEYFPPAHVPFSSGNRGSRKTRSGSTPRFLGENMVFWREYFPFGIFCFSKTDVV